MALDTNRDPENNEQVKRAKRFAKADALVKLLSGLIGIFFLVYVIYSTFLKK
jgi:hypothetical protein